MTLACFAARRSRDLPRIAGAAERLAMNPDPDATGVKPGEVGIVVAGGVVVSVVIVVL